MASSSRPSSSMSCSLRCAYCLMSVMATSIRPCLDVDGAFARHGGDARLDAVAGFVLVAGAEVAHVTVVERQHARLADAHAAAERHLDPDLLAALEDRGGAVEFDALVRDREVNGAALAAFVGAIDGESLDAQ